MIEALAYLLGSLAYIVLFFATARYLCKLIRICKRGTVDYRATKHIRSMNATLNSLTGAL